MNLMQRLKVELTQLYPDMKSYLIDRYVSKYTTAVLAEIRQSLLRPGNENEELSFNSESLKETCGRLDFQGKKIYLFAFMMRSPRTSLVLERFRGHQGKYKRVVLNEEYKDRIMYELLEMPAQGMTYQEQQELDQKANMIIPVDAVSLSNFILKTRATINSTAPGYYLNALHKNYARATELMMAIEEYENVTYLKEYWVEADTGRVYGKFNSLQRMSKEVRHAALGVCHKYDFQAHSFAVMASLARHFEPSIKISAIEDYIKNRTQIRQQIASEVGVPEDAIKTVFTSLGFGAKPIANPYNAIRKAIYGDEAFNRLINNQTFQYINEDLKAINKIVLDNFSEENFELFGRTFVGRDEETNRKKNDSRRLAWIYQRTESILINLFTDYVEQQTGQKPLMTVHDCAYYKQRIPTEVLKDVQAFIRIDNQFEFVKMEHEAIYPISTQEQFENRFVDQLQEEINHRQRIQQAEQEARGYSSRFAGTDNYNISGNATINPFEKYSRPIELGDYEYEYEYEYETEDII